jgi:oligopeptide transport system ATP-binding protein
MKKRTVILSVRDLEVKFRVRGRALSAIRGISLDLYEGESVAVVGESGSGKSVFTKTFAGMLETNGQITGGSIEFEGQDLTKIHRAKDWGKIRGSKIATVFQDPMTSLNPILTIGKQITSVIRRHQNCSEKEARSRALEIMKKVGIPNAGDRFDDYPFQYSGGMRQRIVIAIVLSCQPKILICDEPTTALDVTIQAQILKLIKDLQKEFGYTIVFITHDLGVVANIADRVAVLYAGQIVELGTVEELFYDPRHPYTWALLSSLPQLARRNEKLYSIIGTPPSLYQEITGDAFAPRNPYAMKIDTLKEPPMFQITPTHFARTWLLDPRAPKVEKPEIIRDLHEKMLVSLRMTGGHRCEE